MLTLNYQKQQLYPNLVTPQCLFSPHRTSNSPYAFEENVPLTIAFQIPLAFISEVSNFFVS
jgi:hypothetical protein